MNCLLDCLLCCALTTDPSFMLLVCCRPPSSCATYFPSLSPRAEILGVRISASVPTECEL